LVQNAKSAFRVVQANYMIRFTKYTQIDKVVPKPKNFPRFVYNLVPFSELPSHVNSTARFLGMQNVFCDEKICTTFCHVSRIFNKSANFFPITDVIGYVTAISNVTKVFSGNKLQLRRNITIKDQKYVSSYGSI